MTTAKGGANQANDLARGLVTYRLKRARAFGNTMWLMLRKAMRRRCAALEFSP